MEYTNGAGERFPLPDRPLEPEEDCCPRLAEEGALELEFVRAHGEEFIDFVRGWDGCILLDFIEANRWQWNRFLRGEERL